MKSFFQIPDRETFQEQVAMLMFQLPNGGGYTMNLNDVMDLDVDWRDYLLEKENEWFEEYKNNVSKT